MTSILIIEPKTEIIVHHIPVYDNSDVRKIQSFMEQKKREYEGRGLSLEMVLINMGMVRVMEPGDNIPVPLRPGKGLVIPGGGGSIERED